MKTLYCIIGNLRAGQAPVDSFKKHVLNENTDVALYVGDDYRNSQWRDTRWMAPFQEYPISEYEGYFAKYPNEYVLAMKNIKQKHSL